ncbi:ATP-binding protein [Aquipuribacter sp. SD81]|uniref:ATP-binding protein n=1 Tax=Aquipuribacter sp. SD81 TaxID=3127703 RepID=UPI003019F531
MLRAPAEVVHAEELARLAAADTGPRPPGWRLSPRAVRAFVVGDERLGVRRKFWGDDPLVDRCVVTLMSQRGLLLVGEPGTAKSMLSELLAAAVSGRSGVVVQGSAGTSEEKITYSWNYALLLAEGPSERSLVPGPVYEAMRDGVLCRFEEITRVQPEVQDTLIGLLSDKALHVPELAGGDAVLYARPGFNVLATANLRDRGVHEMSSALKRRLGFETVRPVRDRALARRLVTEQTDALLARAEVDVRLRPEVVDLLVTAFHDLREGMTEDGTVVERPTAVLSSAEAVAVGYAACLDAYYLGDGEVDGGHVARQLVGTVLKDNPDDGTRLRHYLDTVVAARARRQPVWRPALDARRDLDR